MAAGLIKALTVGGLAVSGYLLLNSDAKAADKPRPPYRTIIKVPGNDVPWNTMDDAICYCFEAGETESAALVRCALARVYPDVPWPAQPLDHVSVLRTWQATGNRVAEFLKKVDAGEDPCADVPDNPPPPGNEPTIPGLFTDKPGGLLTIVHSSPATGNPSYAVQTVYAIPQATSNVGRALVAIANSGFNLLFYSRRRNLNQYGSALVGGKSYDIGPAWFPWNNSVRRAADEHRKLARQVGWSGNSHAAGGDGSYGNPFMPPMHRAVGGVLVQDNTDPWAPENNPPASALAELGWTLPEMRTAWEAGNP